MPQVDWAWTLAVAAVGVLAFVMGGIDKVTIVVGPFFIVASCLSLLRQTGRMSIDKEVPLLVITAGVLLLLARIKSIPAPSWLVHVTQRTAAQVRRTAVRRQRRQRFVTSSPIAASTWPH